MIRDAITEALKRFDSGEDQHQLITCVEAYCDHRGCVVKIGCVGGTRIVYLVRSGLAVMIDRCAS